MNVTISIEELEELTAKAALYDKMIADRRKGAQKINNISAEDRVKRAKKAAKARWDRQKKAVGQP